MSAVFVYLKIGSDYEYLEHFVLTTAEMRLRFHVGLASRARASVPSFCFHCIVFCFSRAYHDSKTELGLCTSNFLIILYFIAYAAAYAQFVLVRVLVCLRRFR